MRAWRVAVAALLLAGCSSAPAAKFTAHTTSLDDGALTITTAKPQVTAISEAAAEYELAHSDLGGGGWAQQQVEFGYVTVTPAAMKSDVKGQAAPAAPTHQLAWLLFYEPGASSCPATGPVPTPKFTVAHPSRKQAMIVDASTGTALAYEGAGAGNCITALSPTARIAGGNVSVPWKDPGSGSYVLATFPACVQPGAGTSGSGDASGWTISVIGFRYYELCHAQPITTRIQVSEGRPWKHGPVGPVATGTSG